MEPSVVGQLYQRYRKPVRAFVKHRGNIPPLWVDDITHEVFMRMLKYNPTVAEGKMAAYLFQVAANVMNEWLDRSCFRKRHIDFDEVQDISLFGVVEGPEITTTKDDVTTAVERVISKFDGRRLQIVMLRMHRDLTYKQIASELGLSDRIVLRELTRSYSQLRAEFASTREEFYE